MNGATFTMAMEGFTAVAKPDAKGAWVIGHGHDIPPSPGLTWTLAQADQQFHDIDYPKACQLAAEDLGVAWGIIGEVRQAALADMAFEMGASGLAAFRQMLAAFRIRAWNVAAADELHSLYGSEVPRRAGLVEGMIMTGEWPDLGENANGR